MAIEEKVGAAVVTDSTRWKIIKPEPKDDEKQKAVSEEDGKRQG